MMAGFKSERVAGFNLECLAGFIGIRSLMLLALPTGLEPVFWP